MSRLPGKRIVLALLLIVFLTIALEQCGGGSTALTSSRATRQIGQAMVAEESIESFGTEAEGLARKEILGSERSYFDAIVSRRYSVACSHLASTVKRSVVGLGGSTSHSTCPEMLPVLLTPHASSIARDEASGAVKRVRIEGDRAFIVFHAPGARLYQLPLSVEQGRWRVGLLTASVLAPSASTLAK